ncbi:TadE/TadG family type IV pilus assembly protein [Aurantiacibacter sediminis]|uniref:Pilus assembly protein n=1 Tax=Aurantiacibacter sediminis TaxID=2793064 RepID=A0ABS0N3Y8_9SPHN|nr:TadE/TadG family type IV pilus assembly protein [Aurantiacibacter sediminis]MBH5322686.1 pilus assembly protein [Aurantiacibacter sediminis]
MVSRLRNLARNQSGVAMTEFALTLPFLLGAGLMGLETANRALVQMQISQLAVQIADNASRIGDTSVLEDRKIYEDDINDLFYGAHLQSGAGLDLFGNGRVILSSLQVVDGTENQQYIHWQRCMGTKNHASTYGEEGDGLSTTIAGMGPAGEEVIAFEDDAVMFVEVAYDYQPIVGEPFSFGSHEINAIASFTVRDDRDLNGIYQRDPSAPDTIAECDEFTGSGYAIP